MPRRPSDQSPRSLPPVQARLDDLMLLSDNKLWVQLTLDDETDLSLEFAPDSPVAHDVLDILGRAANERFVRLAQRGIVLTGFTPPVQEEGE